MAKLDVETFPEPELIHSMLVHEVVSDAKYRGLFEHERSRLLKQSENANLARDAYEFIVESLDCCAELIKKTDVTPLHIASFTGDIRHKNLSFWVYQDFFEVSVNPSPKLLMFSQFRLPEDRQRKIKEMLGL